MTPWRIVVSAIVLWICVAMQVGLSPHWIVWGCQPDFLLIALACLCLYTGRAGGATLGFASGFLYSAMANVNMLGLVASRSIAGFLTGWFNSLEMKPNAVVASVTAISITLIARLTLVLLTPPSSLWTFLKATIGSSVYNGILAVPMYLLVYRLMGTTRRYG